MKLPWVIIKPWNLAVSGCIGMLLTGQWAFNDKLIFGVSAVMVLPFCIKTVRAALAQGGGE